MNAPWGVAFAPEGFGEYSGKLLVGNFGDGTIVAFDPATHAAIDYLRDAQGQSIPIEGLWDCNSATARAWAWQMQCISPRDLATRLRALRPNTAAPVPEPETWALFAAGLVLLGSIAKRP